MSPNSGCTCPVGNSTLPRSRLQRERPIKQRQLGVHLPSRGVFPGVKGTGVSTRTICSSPEGLFLSRTREPATGRVLSSLVDSADAASSTAMAGTATSWQPLTNPLLWQGSEAQAMDYCPTQLTPPWRVMLLSDGSVTRHLQLLTDVPINVDCLEMRNIGQGAADMPPGVELIGGPLLQRQVFLRSRAAGGGALVYAASWWSADHVGEYLGDASQPIWESLSKGRRELYREIQQVYHGNSVYLEEQFGTAGPFWGRQYLFWHNGTPLTVVYEVFSSSLGVFLGPQHPA